MSPRVRYVHGVVHVVSLHVRLLDVLGLIDRVLRNDLNPASSSA